MTKKLVNLYQKNLDNQQMAEFYFYLLENTKDIAMQYDNSIQYFDFIINKLDVLDFVKYNDENYQIKDNIKCLNIQEYLNDPYVKNICLKNIKKDQFYFKEETFLPYECFIYQDIILKNDREITPIGYFKQEYKYIALYENKSIWMLITPHEINTMKQAINASFGNVITFGLGLGYFAYMCSLKDNVSSVTIIEKNKKVIELFKQYILPQFKNFNKIKIICADALDYINKDNQFYDYAFVDLYKSVDDGLPIYLKMLKKSLIWSKTKFEFWIEKSLLLMLRRCMITFLYEKDNKIDYIVENKTIYDEIIAKMAEYFKDKNDEIKELEKLISLTYLKKLAYHL